MITMAVGKMADPSMKNFDLPKKGRQRPWIFFFYIVQINLIEKIVHDTGVRWKNTTGLNQNAISSASL